LGCGAELPRDASPKKFAPGTPPQGVPAVKPGAPAPAAAMNAPVPPPAPAAASPVGAAAQAASAVATGGITTVMCPQCDHPNPSNNKFCASCGFKLAKPQLSEAPPAAPAAQAAGGASSVVLTALRADGSEAGTYNMPSGVVTLGRDTGSIFAGDSYLSPRHATFTPKPGKLAVRDESSLNGVYKKLRKDEPIEIKPNDIFRIGQEILRFEPLTPLAPTPDNVDRLGSPSKGYVGRIALVIGRDATGNAYPVPESGLHMGRERGDVLFPEDGYVSGLHCRLSWTGGKLFLTDLGSSNGTFVRLMTDGEVMNGDVLLMGQQLFRIAM
jgi:pSer/pThr/pTyr-binding forkhead associated (FHA) protein